MAYRLEDKDIVVDGWEVGISNSPYQTIVPTNLVAKGVADMRNVDCVTVPGEVSVAFAPANTVTQVSAQAKAFTASDDGSGKILFTWAGGTTLEVNTSLIFATTGSLPTNIAVYTNYYVINQTPTTFQV